MNTQKMHHWGFAILRIGLALVFMWFGSQQLLHPAMWVGFLPHWTSLLAISPTQFILINGLFEIICAILLIINVFTRVVALLLALHLASIAVTIGISPTGVRDFGLAVAILALALLEAKPFNS